jgi:hypothetical protein
MLAIGTINNLKRKNIVAIVDTLVSQNDHGALMVQPDPAIWVNFNQLNEFKQNFPDVPVFGIWQLALENNLIVGEGWYQIFTSDRDAVLTRFEKINGSLKAVESATLGINGCSHAGVHEGNTTVLDLSSPKIKTPKIPFLSPEDAKVFYKNVAVSSRKKTFFLVSALVVLILGLEGIYQYKYSNAAHSVDKLSIEVSDLKKKIGSLSFSKIKKMPSDTDKLNKILNIFKVDSSAATSGNVDFSKPIVLRVSGSLSQSTRFIKNGESFVRHPSGYFEVTVK